MQPAAKMPRSATSSEIRATVGELDDAKLEAILATAATPAELETAVEDRDP